MPAIPDKLQKAVNGLIFNHAFFAAILLKQRIIEDNSRPTMSVNGVELRFNRAFVEGLSHSVLMGVLAHEILHLTNKHHARAKGRDHDTWRKACDYAINPLVTQSGLALPEGALFDSRFAAQGAEEIYRTLMAEQPQPEPESDDNQESDTQDDKGESEGEGAGDSQDSDSEGDTPSDQEGEGDGESDNQGEGAGQGDSDSQSEGNELGNGSEGGAPGTNGQLSQEIGESFGEVDESPKPTDQAEAEADIMVKQAINQARSRGQLPGFIERMVQEVLPRVDWREALAQFVSDTVHNDQSWNRPNRRYISRGMVMPSMHNQTIGNVVFACDTSGSISDEEVTKFSSELLSAMQAFEDVGKVAEVTAIYCDAEVQHVEVLTPFDKPAPKGGGGTDFKPPFVYIEQEQLSPVAVVYMTDGYCDSFPDEPAYPVLWAVIGSYHSFKPPFGQVLLMDINT